LTDDDYLALYPLLPPREIVKEFGKHSVCESQIRNKYRQLRYGTQHQGFKALYKVRMSDCPKDTSPQKWKAKVEAEIASEVHRTKELIWAKIRDKQTLMGLACD